MKKIAKLIGILLGVVTLMSVGIKKTYQIYANNKVAELAKSLANGYHSDYRSNDLRPLNLGTFLMTNSDFYDHDIHPIKKHGWRSFISKNPEIVYQTMEMCHKTFFDSFNKTLLEVIANFKNPKANWKHNYYRRITIEKAAEMLKKEHFWGEYGTIRTPQELKDYYWEKVSKFEKDSAKFANRLANFSIKNYWQEQEKLIDKYQLVAKKLLALPDSTLNSYVAMSNYHPDRQLVEWLEKEELVGKIYDGWLWKNSDGSLGMIYRTTYPCDLIKLSYRFSHEWKGGWTNRRFLTEVVKFTTELKKYLPNNQPAG